MWQFLHIMSFNYPTNPTDEQKKDYLQFLKLLEKTLPCKWCRINYGKNIREKDTNPSKAKAVAPKNEKLVFPACLSSLS